ncbi:copper oxidase [Desulfocurvibacter africanus]|uniref:copper oxidase n=1 Tax=Desulfocurvibacter africanus TaxID=873 RepID=UPI00047F213E|nr:copper oxidase [Desulfocurvibacter africanus]
MSLVQWETANEFRVTSTRSAHEIRGSREPLLPGGWGLGRATPFPVLPALLHTSLALCCLLAMLCASPAEAQYQTASEPDHTGHAGHATQEDQANQLERADQDHSVHAQPAQPQDPASGHAGHAAPTAGDRRESSGQEPEKPRTPKAKKPTRGKTEAEPSEPGRHVFPPLPWSEFERTRLPPGQPGRDYTPVFAPDVNTLPFTLRDDVKVFHLVAEPIDHEFAPGLVARCWGYNGDTPGPLLEAMQGDRVRIYVTNRLPAATSVHWHGIRLPSGMDGAAGLTQPSIPPGKTFIYEFWLPDAGTFMYHSHFDDMTQEAMGLVGMFVVHPRKARPPDRDFAILLQEWRIDPGTARPNPLEMIEFNVLTMNGRAFPHTHPLVAELGDRVRIRLGNLSPQDHHPIHIHGYDFRIVATDGGPIAEAAQWPETTVLVPVGSTRDIELVADNPGDWFFHCHMTHHTMNQMGHDMENMVGVDPTGAEQRISRLLPGWMPMGTRGMENMEGMPAPKNSIPMSGLKGQFGPTTMGGMVTVFRVRERAPGYADPGPYDFPAGTVAREATAKELRGDGIELK